MKEYDTFTLEELRCADYMANRKGPGTGTTAPTNTGATGLFGAAPNQTAPASGGLFGSPAATTQQNTLFGANQQQNKPLFGATGGTTGGFGQPTSAFGQTNSAFGTPNTATSGGIFGAKPAPVGFGAAATTASSGFGFGGQTNTATNMFGQNQQNTGFGNKPFGAAQPQTSQPLFGASTGGFGTTAAAPAFGATGTTGGFGQPQQQNSSIGLFGQQNQAKPAFGFGAAGASSFGSTATTNTGTSSFSFGQNTNSFGAQQQKTPAFGQTATAGFGGTTGGFGTNTFGATQPAQNNMFGATAAKPAFGAAGTSFGTGGTSFGGAATSFGGTAGAFGATGATGGLFGSNQAGQKPLFGGSTSFGGGSTGFGGGAASTFNAGGSNFSAFNSQQPQNQQQNQPAPQISLQSQLASLTGNPYGDNPLFKNLLPDQHRREEMLKPTNPVAQKAVMSAAGSGSGTTPYKVSPHLKSAKVKAIQKNTGNKSTIFEGLDEDENPEIFVPRSSVKKLVLKPKVTETPENSGLDMEKSSSVQAALELEESLNLPSIKPLKTVKTVQVEVHDESFSNFITKQASNSKPDETSILTPPESADTSQEYIEEPDEPLPAGIKLKRAGYYTIPSMSELATMVDLETGNLMVENFTIGRAGYGNIFFPGLTNIKNMNFDDVVFFRHKEVIVYPDDDKKPDLGTGLNKKAQVTLDKVWPVDKTSHSSVKSPEKLNSMNYEEKLQKACLKLGARFVEYRPETGSWVFKVDHFSKYGLDDSDEEELIEAKQKEQLQQTKKLKTLQLRENTGM